MKNVTISMEEDVALWVRVLAARRNTSVSKLVGEILKDKMRAEDRYQQAQEAFFAQKPYITKAHQGGERPYPRREELYDRSVLRGH